MSSHDKLALFLTETEQGPLNLRGRRHDYKSVKKISRGKMSWQSETSLNIQIHGLYEEWEGCDKRSFEQQTNTIIYCYHNWDGL